MVNTGEKQVIPVIDALNGAGILPTPALLAENTPYPLVMVFPHLGHVSS
jgi:hypothetical protein